jgi:hypothetical protein
MGWLTIFEVDELLDGATEVGGEGDVDGVAEGSGSGGGGGDDDGVAEGSGSSGGGGDDDGGGVGVEGGEFTDGKLIDCLRVC